MNPPSVLLGTPLSSDFSMLPDHHLSVLRMVIYSLENNVVGKFHTSYVRSANVWKNRNLIWKAAQQMETMSSSRRPAISP